MENREILLRRLNSLALGHLPQGVHNMSNIDVIGASGGTCFTGGTDPDGVALQHSIEQAKMKQTHHLVRQNIHSESYRAAIGAFLALKAG